MSTSTPKNPYINPPSMGEMKSIMQKRELSCAQWPCTSCFGTGCDVCSGTGIGSRSAFSTWYSKFLKNRDKYMKQLQDRNDLDGRDLIGDNFYDLELLRRISSS